MLPADSSDWSVLVTLAGWLHDRDRSGVDAVDVEFDDDDRVPGVGWSAARPPQWRRGCY